jgi:hypothetical protein
MTRRAPAAATFTFDEITALPPPIAARIGRPSNWVDASATSSNSLFGAHDRARCQRIAGPSSSLMRSSMSRVVHRSASLTGIVDQVDLVDVFSDLCVGTSVNCWDMTSIY